MQHWYRANSNAYGVGLDQVVPLDDDLWAGPIEAGFFARVPDDEIEADWPTMLSFDALDDDDVEDAPVVSDDLAV